MKVGNFLANCNALPEPIITSNHHWISKITVIFDLEEGFSSQLSQSFYQGLLEGKPKVKDHPWNMTRVSVHLVGKSKTQHEQVSVSPETRAARCFLNELSRQCILNLLLNSTTSLCKNWPINTDGFSLCSESSNFKHPLITVLVKEKLMEITAHTERLPFKVACFYPLFISANQF